MPLLQVAVLGHHSEKPLQGKLHWAIFAGVTGLLCVSAMHKLVAMQEMLFAAQQTQQSGELCATRSVIAGQ